MTSFSIKQIDDMEAVYAGTFKRARAELGVSSFGISVIDLPPNIDRYPEHDHAKDGQEEVYMALAGSGEIQIEGESHPLEPGWMVRVGPGVNRKVLTGDDSLRMLIVGAVPDAVYTAPALSELGAPDPLAQPAA